MNASLGTLSSQDANPEEDVDSIKELIILVSISRMAGCVYRL